MHANPLLRELCLSQVQNLPNRAGISPCTLSYKTQAEWSNFIWTFPEWKRLRVEIPGLPWTLSFLSIGVQLFIIDVIPIPRHPEDALVVALVETIGNLLVYKIREYNLNIFFFETVLLFNFGWPQTHWELLSSVNLMLTTSGKLWFRFSNNSSIFLSVLATVCQHDTS